MAENFDVSNRGHLDLHVFKKLNDELEVPGYSLSEHIEGRLRKTIIRREENILVLIAD